MSDLGRPRANCPVCGKEVILKDSRASIPFCSNKCAKNLRYLKRYSGKVNLSDKGKILEDLSKFK
jgi:predicted nucleic acid-binding Zn ribbon protein